MSHNYLVEYDGFEFLLALGQFRADGVVVIDIDAPLSDERYLTALRHIQTLLPYYEADGYLDETGGYDFRGGEECPPALLVIEAYEKQLIPVSEKTYQLAVSLRDASQKRMQKYIKSKKVIPGYVYLMADSYGLHKIGYSNNPAKRLKGLSTPGNRITLVCKIATADMCKLEDELHQKFDAKWVDGEWFRLADEDIVYIKSLAGEA